MAKSEVARVLRRTGFTAEKVDEILAQVAEPVDLERDQAVWIRYGITRSHLEDLMGGSP
jgi:hypothetical protein